MIIAIDFDGTIVHHEYPRIGGEVPEAIDTIKHWVEKGHKIILWTMRSGKELEDAVSFLESHGVELWGINSNPTQESWTNSPKAYAQVYIDDAALGCPRTQYKDQDRPSVHWAEVRRLMGSM